MHLNRTRENQDKKGKTGIHYAHVTSGPKIYLGSTVKHLTIAQNCQPGTGDFAWPLEIQAMVDNTLKCQIPNTFSNFPTSSKISDTPFFTPCLVESFTNIEGMTNTKSLNVNK